MISLKVISGCIIEKDGKILMVKEANPICYGKWNFPAGIVDEGEKIQEAAHREVFEETGCEVQLQGVLPIVSVETPSGETHVLIRFMAKITKENISFDKNEILEVSWLTIEEIKKMSIADLRGFDTTKKWLNDIENGNIYPVDLISNLDFPNS